MTPSAKSLGPTLEDRKYPCDKCGKLRSKAEGGTVFTVCDECWDAKPPTLRGNDE